MKIIINSPSLDTNKNVSGMASVTEFIMKHNTEHEYLHFELGKQDSARRNLSWFLGLLKAYLKWIIILVTKKSSLVHFNLAMDTFGIVRDLPLIYITQLFGKRLVVHLHGGELLHREVPLWMHYVLTPLFYSKHHKIVLSEAEKKALEQNFKCRNVVVLPNCIGLQDAKAFRRNYNNKQKLTILFIGRIALSKGIVYVYRALEELQKQQVDFRFIIAGKGPVDEEYIGKFTNLLGSKFEYRGVVSGADKTALFKESDIFVLPSFFEGLPMALLETMSFGIVPVTTCVGSIGYVVTDKNNGIFIAKESGKDIVDAIKELVADPGYIKKLSMNSKDFIFQNYNPDHYVNRLNNLYKVPETRIRETYDAKSFEAKVNING